MLSLFPLELQLQTCPGCLTYSVSAEIWDLVLMTVSQLFPTTKSFHQPLYITLLIKSEKKRERGEREKEEKQRRNPKLGKAGKSQDNEIEYLEKWLFRRSINDRVNKIHLIKSQLQPFWYQRQKKKGFDYFFLSWSSREHQYLIPRKWIKYIQRSTFFLHKLNCGLFDLQRFKGRGGVQTYCS